MNAPQYDLCVVGGAGHVGLPLALVFASKGMSVLLYDIDEAALASIQQGKVPFIEEGAEALLQSALSAGRLFFTSRPDPMRDATTLIVTIGTPVDEFLNPDMKGIRSWAESALPHLRDGQLLILRSTVYPGTTGWLDQYLRASGKKIAVAFCPERILQGRAIEELQSLTQIISGTTPEAQELAAQLFRRIAPDLVFLTPLEAEFAKLFTNAYRYIQFAAANQFYMIANDAGVDYNRILAALKHNYERARDIPGAGFAAGPCLLKDTMQLAAFSQNHFVLGHSAMLVNEGLILYLANRLRTKYELQKMCIGLLGMAFKADNDDTRSSLSYKLKKVLRFHAKEVITTDPYVRHDPELLPLETVLEKSDLLILCVPHRLYRNLQVGDKPLVDVWNFLGRGSRI